MCGIAGIFYFEKDQLVSENVLRRMTDSLEHRGPDDAGVYVNNHIGLGNRRLSIIDLAGGHQPMCNEDGSLWITYNGEVYNHNEVRACLLKKGHQFSTRSDTEVIVHAYEEYGTECVHHLQGQFAFAIWDDKNKQLFLARDRMGEKTLAFTVQQGAFLFASEVKALLLYPGLQAAISPYAVAESLLCNAVLEDRTLFETIRQLPPGYCLTISMKNGVDAPRRYWDIPMKETSEQAGEETYIETVLDSIKKSVAACLMSEVPLGCLLSGGIDSSMITLWASRLAEGRLKTFTIEYTHQFDRDDTKFSELVARELKTEHHLFTVTEEEYYSSLEKISWHLEKPFDVGAATLYLLYKRIKENATVILSGEGADELLGGYFNLKGLGLKDAAASGLLTHVPWVDFQNEILGFLHPDFKKETQCEQRIPEVLQCYVSRVESANPLNRLLYLFLKIFLVELLQSHDRLGLASSVESRAPFLNHRLVEWLCRLPVMFKVNDGVEKYILRRSVEKTNLLPATVAQRAKRAIPSPKGESLRRQLRELSGLIFSPESRCAPYFDQAKLKQFLNAEGAYRGVDPLILYRVSFSLLTLEMLHRVFSPARFQREGR